MFHGSGRGRGLKPRDLWGCSLCYRTCGVSLTSPSNPRARLDRTTPLQVCRQGRHLVGRRQLHLLLRPLRLRRRPREGRLGRRRGPATPLPGLRRKAVLQAGRAVVAGVRQGGPVRVSLRSGNLGLRRQRAGLGLGPLDHVRGVLRHRRVLTEYASGRMKESGGLTGFHDWCGAISFTGG